MNILTTLLFTKALRTKKVNPKQISRKIRKEAKFWVNLITELVQLISIIFKFIFVGIGIIYKKCICQTTVMEIKQPKSENVINFNEYKLKKAK